jgi:CheY-like chemotaxis protein
VIRLAIVDDQALVREGLALILGAEPDIEVVAEFADGAELLRDPVRADLILLDLYLPGADGVTTMRDLRARQPEVKVLMLTTVAVGGDVDEARRCGEGRVPLRARPRYEVARAPDHDTSAGTSPGASPSPAAAESPAPARTATAARSSTSSIEGAARNATQAVHPMENARTSTARNQQRMRMARRPKVMAEAWWLPGPA